MIYLRLLFFGVVVLQWTDRSIVGEETVLDCRRWGGGDGGGYALGGVVQDADGHEGLLHTGIRRGYVYFSNGSVLCMRAARIQWCANLATVISVVIWFTG